MPPSVPRSVASSTPFSIFRSLSPWRWAAARISIRNLLQLNQGSVVELDWVAGEPLDVLVNGTLIAHGEVVVVNDKFGIRLTDVISQIERIKKLK